MMSPVNSQLRAAARQEQFLEVVSRDEAAARFERHLKLEPLGSETVPLAEALGRVLAGDVAAEVDVPGFDRSNVDGFAVQAADTFGAMEEQRRRVRLNAEVLSPGVKPTEPVRLGTATVIATGGMLPRGADAVVMIEYTEPAERDSKPPVEKRGQAPSRMETTGGSSEQPGASPLFSTGSEVWIEIARPVSPGENVAFAGTDIARGEMVLRGGQLLTSREIGVLAAIGRAEVEVLRRPQVAIVSTGDEIVPPGGPRPPGTVYDSNLAILTAAVEELGGEPVPLGIVADDEQRLQEIVSQALEYDMVVLSGGTSKGAGDLSYRVVSRLENPGIVAHGVALKPGKPICLAVTEGKPVVILPGFPTSAIFTFHEFVALVIRAYAGRRPRPRDVVEARLPLRVHSDRGRTEYLLVGLVRTDDGLTAYPMGKGSGSVTTFSGADGFLTIGPQTEFLEAGSVVPVHLLSQGLEAADLVAIGSHCVGLDFLLGRLHRRGCTTKALHVGSTGGLAAARRGECDIAGIHLMDPETGEYNRPFLTPELELLPGYRRMQAIVFRPGDERFERKSSAEALQAALADPDCTLVNRNAGSGTRILIDRLLEGRRPPGYAMQPKSHNAVAAAISQGRADWGVAIDTVARQYGLAFIPLQEEHYDFVVPKSRRDRPAVQAFRELLAEDETRQRLGEMGFRL